MEGERELSRFRRGLCLTFCVLGGTRVHSFAIENAGCEVGTLDIHGCNALSYARNAEVVDLLLRHDLNMECCDKYGDTPLFTAVNHGLYEVLQRLLERGANKYAVESQGLDLLSTAIMDDRPACLRALLKHHKATEVRMECSNALPSEEQNLYPSRIQSMRRSTMPLA